jgi:hypothetical protein
MSKLEKFTKAKGEADSFTPIQPKKIRRAVRDSKKACKARHGGLRRAANLAGHLRR